MCFLDLLVPHTKLNKPFQNVYVLFSKPVYDSEVSPKMQMLIAYTHYLSYDIEPNILTIQMSLSSSRRDIYTLRDVPLACKIKFNL